MQENFVYSKQFLKHHWEQLIEIGIPIVVLKDIKKWSFLIEHGDALPFLPFTLENIGTDKLTQLYDIIVII